MDKDKVQIPVMLTPEMLKASSLRSTANYSEKIKNQDLSERSDEVQEIIGKPPHWLIRAGIGVFFGVLVLLFIGASFVKYPEVIGSELTLVAVNAPKTVESKVYGKIIRLFKEDNSEVLEGEVLGWIESTSSHQAVQKLSSEIDSLEKWIEIDQYESIKRIEFFSIQQLGELQSGVQSFTQVFREYILHLPGEYFDQRKITLVKERDYIKELLLKLESQKNIQNENYEIELKEFEAQKKLSEKGLIAELEFLKAEGELSNKKLPLQQTESSIINNHLSQISKDKEILEIERQGKEAFLRFNQALLTLQSSVSEWERKYVLMAPISGTLIYSGVIQEQQLFNSSEEIFYIEPQNAEFFGEMEISQSSYGKIKQEQQVKIRFSGYPHHEFGSVLGKIIYISKIPVNEGKFYAKVYFPEGLQTNYNQVLPPTNGMKGEAEIITKDMRLLERIYNNLTKELR